MFFCLSRGEDTVLIYKKMRAIENKVTAIQNTGQTSFDSEFKKFLNYS